MRDDIIKVAMQSISQHCDFADKHNDMFVFDTGLLSSMAESIADEVLDMMAAWSERDYDIDELVNEPV